MRSNNHLTVNVKVSADAHTPEYQTDGSSGMDLCSREDGVLMPGEYRLIKTGVFIEMPDNLEAQVRPRSGLAMKYGVTVLNSPGTIDSDYRGEIGILLINFGKNKFTYEKGDRLAQIVFSYVPKVEIKIVNSLNGSKRGEGGFGHTGY